MNTVGENCQITDEDGNICYKCNICEVVIKIKGSFTTHYKKHYDQKRKTFIIERNEQIKERCKITDQKGRTSYRCDICANAGFTNSKNLILHYMVHLPSDQKAGIHYKKKTNIPLDKFKEIKERGRYMENDVEVFKCHLCPKTYLHATQFVSHVYFHETNVKQVERRKTKERCKFITADGQQLYKCDLCGNMIKTAKHLLEHYDKHLGNESKRRNWEIRKRCKLVDKGGKAYYECRACLKILSKKGIVTHYKAHENRGELNEDGTLVEGVGKSKKIGAKVEDFEEG